MRLTTAVLCAAALAVTAVPAEADKKPMKQAGGCVGGLRDPQGDSTFRSAPGFESNDIVGGDLAVSPSQVVAVLRLAAATTSGSPRPGTRWEYSVVMRGVRHVFAAEVTVPGDVTSSVSVGGAARAHTFAMKDDVLVWRVKRADTTLGGDTMHLAAETSFVTTADTAEARLVRRADGKWCAQRK